MTWERAEEILKGMEKNIYHMVGNNVTIYRFSMIHVTFLHEGWMKYNQGVEGGIYKVDLSR